MPKRQFDHEDITLLNALQRQGDLSLLQLSKKVGLGISTVFSRISRLKKAGLLPSIHYALNKEALGYREVFLVKINARKEDQALSALEKTLLDDGLVEQLWLPHTDDTMGAAVYKALVRARNTAAFGDWCAKLIKTHQCMIEHERVDILLKERSSLKVTHHDLPALRKLEEDTE
ncbi:MAG: Lrp/AsnC family transcriptional regulator [Bacteroidetes bacterium]|jgi:DNA-binding Lrp family transcriptional regulator|nr:Lrp/AsnC family transcriptional regulator [Bacteroidota bacterium]